MNSSSNNKGSSNNTNTDNPDTNHRLCRYRNYGAINSNSNTNTNTSSSSSSSRSMPSSSSSSNRRHGRQKYTSVANNDEDEDDHDTNGDEFHDEPIAKDRSDDNNDDGNNNNNESNSNESNNEDDEDCNLSITILDSAQKKFPVPCRADWTVGKFKRKSARIHKVAPSQQRLIFRGKMLTNDEQTLQMHKLDTNDLIVHLFPKPRVLITTSKDKTANKDKKSGGTSTSTSTDDDDDGDSGIVDYDDDNNNNDNAAGAHITTIVIDQEEQDRRGQILVLGSVEIAESQNNVKMLSLLLVMICAMRLLALFSIAMGDAQEPNDPYHQHYPDNSSSINGNGNGSDINGTIHGQTGNMPHDDIYDTVINASEDQDYVPRSWQTPDYFDLFVSVIGFYVGTLGMRATQENTFRLATAYAIGTIVAGIGWNVWNVYEYIRFFKEQTDYRIHDHEGNSTHTHDHANGNGNDPYDPGSNSSNNYSDEYPPLTRDDFVTVAFFTILMPLFVWFLCCVRAFEFRRLLREAEEEAAGRIRNEYVVREGMDGDTNDSGIGNADENGNANLVQNTATEIV